MFDLFAKLLSSLASFLFPIFASYKALKTSDPAELTPWLMYWIVFSIALLVESWFDWFLVWVPFYGYVRLFFFLYLILPQTQGARVIYEEHVHPFLHNNEGAIEELIASAHERLRAAGLLYLKQAIDFLKTNVLGLPPSEPTPSAQQQPAHPTAQSYTQALLSRFSVPSARWSAGAAAGAGADFYGMLASAVSAATAATADVGGDAESAAGPTGASPGASQAAFASSSGLRSPTAQLVPSSICGTSARISFISAQREKLSILQKALDREAAQLEAERGSREGNEPAGDRVPSMSMDGGAGGGLSSGSGSGDDAVQTPPGSAHSVGAMSGLSKTRSEVDFEKIDAESGAEDNEAASSASSISAVSGNVSSFATNVTSSSAIFVP